MKTFSAFFSPRSLPFAATALLKCVVVWCLLTASVAHAATATAPATTGTQFVNTAMAARAGTFTVTYSAVPSAGPMDGVVALSLGSQTAFGGLAAAVRFNTAGNIDARNGGAYAAAAAIPYTAGQTYTFRLVVNVPAHTYSIYVTPPGGSELTVGSDYAFRTGQNTMTSLNNWVVAATNPPGGALLTVNDFTVDGEMVPEPVVVAAPVFSPVSGVVTSGQWVMIASATSGATIRYTTDGSTPTATTGTVYNAPISITSSTTLKAIAYVGSPTGPVNVGNYAVAAAVVDPNYTGSASGTLVIAPGIAAVALDGLNRVYDGQPKPVTATTNPTGLAMTLTYNGSTTPPTTAGTYAVVATVNSGQSYTGFATEVLTIAQAAASVTLGNLAQTYDGTPKPVSVTTAPSGLVVALNYGTGATPPTGAGSYPVSATVVDANYAGWATGTLEIGQAVAVVAIGETKQRYDGTPKAVSVTTTPKDLPVTVTYDDAPTPPTYPGSHAVAVTVDDPNYLGIATDTLEIGITALVNHGLVLNGDIDGSAQVLLPENSTFNGQAFFSGDLLVPGVPAVVLNGHPTYGGTIDGSGGATPTNYAITLNGGALVAHVVRRVDPLALPVVTAPPPPAGTRDVAINNSNQSPGDYATLRNLTLNGNAGQIAVPPGTYGNFAANGNSSFTLGVAGATEPAVYNLQNLTLNGNAELRLAGPVVITLANGVAFNGSVNEAGDSAWLTLRVAAGGVTLNGNVRLNGAVIAPGGTVTVNGNTQLAGSVVADGLTVNGNGLLTDPDL